MWGSVHSVTEGCSGICKSLCNEREGMMVFVEAVKCDALRGGRKGGPGDWSRGTRSCTLRVYGALV